MDEYQPIWESWSATLHHWGLSRGVAALLEGSGSFGWLAAQVVYLSQPLVSGFVSAHTLQTLAQVLEDPARKQAFSSFLRREYPGKAGGELAK